MLGRAHVILPMTCRGRHYHTTMDCRAITIIVGAVPQVPLFKKVKVVEMRRMAGRRHLDYTPCPLCANNVKLREN